MRYNVILVLILLLFINFKAWTQVTYSSRDNSISNWENNGSWTKSQTWADDNPGNSLGGATDDVIIYGYVTRNGNLTVGGDIRLIVNDTLVIKGNVNAAGGSSIIVNNNGILIVLGNLVTAGGLNFDNIGNGIVAVAGDFSASGGANIETNDQFYLYDNNPNFNGGASVNGENPRGNPADEFKNETELGNEYPLLKQFIDSNGSIPLPIELKSFSATLKSNSIQVNWTTAKEENFSHFEVERSVDQKTFEMIGIIQGQGESFSDVHYNFEDTDPIYGKIYYRLKAVDIDDTFEFSPVVSVENSFKGQLSLYPNPISESSAVKIRVPSGFTENISHLALYNIEGGLIQEFVDFNPAEELKISMVKAGLYLLKVQHNGLEENIRVIIN